MRAVDVELGQTYRVHIPRRDTPIRHLCRHTGRGVVDIALAQLAINGGDDFDLTVTDLDGALGDEATVTGIRTTRSSRIRVPLDPRIADELGLDPTLDYEVNGLLCEAVTGAPITLPAEQTLTVPVRWLRPT
ncbi:hypothetical protein [Actinokineospora sp. HUAS TT18]|uniref:hypothetical protein n=1 Tax=Actinokineospora sp. HUAS TT18 TaxID=3447451 RepID=UPI003F51E054